MARAQKCTVGVTDAVDETESGTVAGGAEGRRPRSLTRAEILDTAIALVDSEGWIS